MYEYEWLLEDFLQYFNLQIIDAIEELTGFDCNITDYLEDE